GDQDDPGRDFHFLASRRHHLAHFRAHVSQKPVKAVPCFNDLIEYVRLRLRRRAPDWSGSLFAVHDCCLRCHTTVSFAPRFSAAGCFQFKLAGAEGFEPPSPVLETGSLTVELTPLNAAFSS